jgi:DNA-binding transcriptional LysR family regulator
VINDVQGRENANAPSTSIVLESDEEPSSELVRDALDVAIDEEVVHVPNPDVMRVVLGRDTRD